MKSIGIMSMAVATLLSFSSCRSESQKESDAIAAEDVNDENLEGEQQRDAERMVEIANLNLQEIHLSELAYSKATMPDTKEMATMILNDHRLAGAELTVIAQKAGVTLPTVPDTESTRKYDRLNGLEGKDLDKEYADMMKNGHEEAIRKFEGIRDETQNAELRDFVNAKLPALRTHLQHAEHCQDIAAKSK